MNEMFSPVKSLLKPKNGDVFNFTFNLHTKYTVVIMLGCSLLLCAQFAREPITCLPGAKLINEKMMESFCWVNGTFTIPENPGILARGIGNFQYDAPKRYVKYYQWLSILLLLQASLFYLPRYVWKIWEGRRFLSLIPADSNNSSPPKAKDASVESGNGVDAKKEKAEKTSSNTHLLVKFFTVTSHRRKAFVTKYMICEFLNTVNVIGQVILVNYIFGYEFLWYGYDVLDFLCSENGLQWGISPMDDIFPKLAKCTFYKYGPSGTVEAIDALCVLGWNIIYEKIFFIMWWWFLVLILFTSANLACRFLALFCRKFRYYLLKDVAVFTRSSTVEKIVKKADFADVFVLCKVAKQLNHENFEKFLEDLSRKL